MKATLIATASLMLVLALLLGGMSSAVRAAPDDDPMNRIKLETGYTNDYGGGNYVAVNMATGGSTAWFGVIYGTEDHPAPITLVGSTIRYLGGAQIVNGDGNVVLKSVPIPILTVFAQSLFAVFEFDDTGIAPFWGGYGAGNGVFDYNGLGLLFSQTNAYEPVYKYVNLNRSWSLSAVDEVVDNANQSKHYEFSLYAENVLYDKVWDNELKAVRNGTTADGVLERIEFRFHVTATAKTVTAEVPFYEVTVEGGHVTNSEQIAPRNYSGTGISCDFKYDHIFEGWDAYPNATSPHIMVENAIGFGTFVPKIVEEWYNAQFVSNNVEDGDGVMEYTTGTGTKTVRTSSQLPDRATLLTKDEISFRDNWERIGKLVWVSNVTVDGHERQAYYQVHAAANLGWMHGDAGAIKLLFVLGGYIYPAGQSVYHDPSFLSQALQIEDKTLGGIIVVLMVGVVVVCVAMLLVLFLIRRANKRESENFNYRSPPGFRP